MEKKKITKVDIERFMDSPEAKMFRKTLNEILEQAKEQLKEKMKMKEIIKIRDMTPEQWDNYKEKNCSYNCNVCAFYGVPCALSCNRQTWIYNKQFYSDKFLDQKIEVETQNILNKKEKEYLRAVIKPFRDEIDCIFKHKNDMTFKSYISIKLKDKTYIHFPDLKDNKMYANMELDYHYTLEELDL